MLTVLVYSLTLTKQKIININQGPTVISNAMHVLKVDTIREYFLPGKIQTVGAPNNLTKSVVIIL